MWAGYSRTARELCELRLVRAGKKGVRGRAGT